MGRNRIRVASEELLLDGQEWGSMCLPMTGTFLWIGIMPWTTTGPDTDMGIVGATCPWNRPLGLLLISGFPLSSVCLPIPKGQLEVLHGQGTSNARTHAAELHQSGPFPSILTLETLWVSSVGIVDHVTSPDHHRATREGHVAYPVMDPVLPELLLI